MATHPAQTQVCPEPNLAFEMAITRALSWYPSETGPSYEETRAQVKRELLAALLPSGQEWRGIESALKNLMQAAKGMPLWTPTGGGASTKHTYQIAAAEVWALDRALREANELLEALPTPPSIEKSGGEK